MKKNKSQYLIYLFIMLVFSNCALHYNLVQPQNSIFENDANSVTSNLTFECSTSYIVSANSSTLSRRLEKNKLIFVPVKITNNSNDTIKISDIDIEMINDYVPAQIVSPTVYLKSIRQKIWPNLLLIPAAILASFSKKEDVMDDGAVFINHSYRINVLSGGISAWTLINSARTLYENKRAEKFFVANDLMSMESVPHSTIYGLICIKGESLNKPMIRIKN